MSTKAQRKLNLSALCDADQYEPVVAGCLTEKQAKSLPARHLANGLSLMAVEEWGLLWALGEPQFPRSALAIYWFIAFSYVVASRTAVRNFLRRRMLVQPGGDHPVAIYGAGESGAASLHAC